MKTVNVHEAKTQLSKLIEDAVSGDPFVVAKAGKHMVVVTKVDSPAPKLLGFSAGQATIPEDFDTFGGAEIQAMFEGLA